MKMISISIIAVLVLFISCTASSHGSNELPAPELKLGMAKLSGQVMSNKEPIPFLEIISQSLFSSEAKTMEVPVDSNGLFSVEIPLETSVSYVKISSKLLWNCDQPFVFLENEKETKLKIFRKEEDGMEIEIVKGMYFHFMQDEFNYVYDYLLGRMLMLAGNHPDYHLNKDSLNRFLLHPRDYASYAIRSDLGKRLEPATKDTLISSQSKIILENILKLIFAESLFRYPKAMSHIYDIVKADEDTTFLIPPRPGRDYYTYLQEFDLNNPKYLYEPAFLNTLFQTLLRDEVLQIPRIEETSLDEWLTQAKAILAECVGSDNGLFYDLLVINAYSGQLRNEKHPLSNKQINNLKSYYKGGEVEKLILRKNEEVLEDRKDMQASIIVPVPNVPNEELLDTIISRYRGKVVVVDFWATWCGPCLAAMDKMKTLKREMQSKDVVFIYFSDTSSPEGLWKEKAKGIGGEHYYFKEQSQWITLMDHFRLDGMPFYVILDKDGKYIESFTGFPGNNIFKEIIERLSSCASL